MLLGLELLEGGSDEGKLKRRKGRQLGRKKGANWRKGGERRWERKCRISSLCFEKVWEEDEEWAKC